MFLVGGGCGGNRGYSDTGGAGGYTKTFKKDTSGWRDGDAIPVIPGQSISRRTKRGLFKTSFGRTINADINGAFNIIRKSEKESFDVTMLPEGRGFWWNPVRISV